MADLLGQRPDGPARLPAMLADTEPVVAPGAYDALSARLMEAAGFPAVYMTGFGVTASLIGRPDVRMLTMTEMVQTARRIVSTVAVPVIADADTGYGNALNVVRTVQEYEAAATAAVREVIDRIKRDGSPINAVHDLPGFAEFTGLVGYAEVQEIARRFANG